MYCAFIYDYQKNNTARSKIVCCFILSQKIRISNQ